MGKVMERKGTMQMETVEEKTGNMPEREVTLDRIAGMEVSKRALEVALAGGHPIVFVFNSNSQAVDLVRAGKRIAEKHGLVFHGLAYPACKCGNYASRTSECRCRPVSMARHLAGLARRKDEFDLWIDACRVNPTGMDSVPREPSETEEDMAGRILAARNISKVSGEPGREGRELLNAYQKHVGRAFDASRILRVAQTISRLEGNGKALRSYHVAEAIQYQALSLSWIWDMVGPERVEARIGEERIREGGANAKCAT